MKRKWIDPLDRLLEGDKKANAVAEYMSDSEKNDIHDLSTIDKSQNQQESTHEQILEIATDKIIRWKYKNRPENELTNIDLLADKFKTQGQQEPCIVRPVSENSEYFELITGERRWNAAIKAGLKLKVIVRSLNDLQASVAQKEENDKDPVSEYANGICYAKQIEDGILRQSDLVNELGFSKQYVSRLLSFSKIPEEVISSIGDMTQVSSGTAEKIKQLCSKGEKYKEAIIKLADKIRLGKLGHNRLEKIVINKVDVETASISNSTKIYSKSGRHIFTWRHDSNQVPSIHFPKDIIKIIDAGKIEISTFLEKISETIQNEMMKIK